MELKNNVPLSGVDLAKFIMAFAVVAIHVSTNSALGIPFPEIIQWFIALAVPFFFITSGYLLERKLADIPTIDLKRKCLSDRSGKLLKIFIYWLIIYLPIAIYVYSFSDYPIWKDILAYIRSVILNGETPYAWPLWFIYSMSIVLFILSKALFRKYALPLLTGLFIIVSFLNSATDFGYILGDSQAIRIFNMLTHRTIGGGIYILGGIIIYKYENQLRNYYVVIAMTIYSLISYFFHLPFSALAGGISLFVFALMLNPPQSEVFLTLRKLSMWIYYTHMLVIFPYITIAHHYDMPLNLWYTYAACSMASLIIAIILNRLSYLYPFKWLSILIK